MPLHGLPRCVRKHLRSRKRTLAAVRRRRQSSSGSIEVADWIADAFRESQGDKEHFHRTALMQLQQRYLTVQAKLDRAYDDRLAGRITDELWERKSGEWEAGLESVRRETVATSAPAVTTPLQDRRL